MTIKCSNYPIEEIKITEDFDKLKLLSNIGEVSTNLGNGNTRHTQREVLYPNILTMHQFTYKMVFCLLLQTCLFIKISVMQRNY